MIKSFLILFIFLFISQNQVIAQTILKKKEIVKLTSEDFPTSIYCKVLKSPMEIKTISGSAKTVDDGCVLFQNRKYYFEKEKTTFVFQYNTDTTKTNYLLRIIIEGISSPFITEDSIKVGDKILITTICKDIEKLKDQVKTRNENYVNYILHNNITYYFKRTSLSKINSKTVFKIKKIVVST